MSNVQKMLTSYKQVYEANKTYVDKKVADLVNGAPEQLDTLQELSKALNNDKDYATTVNNALAEKLGRTEKAVSAKTADSVSFAGVTGKPSTYPPSSHNHDSAYPATNGSRASGTWGINITGSSDNAGHLNNLGTQTALSGGNALPRSGLSVYQVYNNGYPCSFGNVLSIGGAGQGQIVAGWSGSNGGVERLYYRNKRDNLAANWSEWRGVAFTTDIPTNFPSKTGTGASGTWGINITGSSASCTGNAKTASSCTGNSSTANTAGKIGEGGNTGNPITFHWSGQSGQPTWMWGGNDRANQYVYNPSNFRVSYANSAGSANAVAWGNVSSKPASIVKVASWDGSTLNLTTCT